MASVDGTGRPVGCENVGGVEEDSVPNQGGWDGDTIIRGKVPRKERNSGAVCWAWVADISRRCEIWMGRWLGGRWKHNTVLICRDSFQKAKSI